MNNLIRADKVQRVWGLIRNPTVVNSCPIKGFRCFIEQDTLYSSLTVLGGSSLIYIITCFTVELK